MKIIRIKVHLLLIFFLPTVLQATAAHTTIVHVFDEKGEPLPGVHVYTKDFSFVGNTNNDGEVQITVNDTNSEVKFSFIGYKNVELHYRELTQTGGKLFMIPLIHTLTTFVVHGRRDDPIAHSSQKIKIISAERIAKSFSNTSADLLGREGNLFIQKSQLGGGSPIIRGFEANRVLMVVDGVRMNNAIYRNGHLQNSITIDPSMLQQVEVIYGPGSLIYGSDALGGVIHFRSKDPMLYLEEDSKGIKTSVNASTRFGTASNAQIYHTDFNIGTRKWGFLTSLSYSDFGDLKSGARRKSGFSEFGKRKYYVTRTPAGEDQLTPNQNPNVQVGSGYSQYDLLQKIKFQPSDQLSFVLNLQLSNTTDIPRYDRLTEEGGDGLKFAEWYYGPQLRSLVSLKTKILKPTKLFNKATIIGTFQRIGEDRHDRKFGSNIKESSLVDLNIFSATADLDKSLDYENRHWLNYGVDYNYNKVHSSAFSTNITSNERMYNVNARYPSGGSHLQSLGAYMNYVFISQDSALSFDGGLRYNRTDLGAQFSSADPIEWPENYVQGITANNAALTWATGVSLKLKRHWTIKAGLGTAFRSPNIDDFAKFREKDGFISIPNPTLIPEKSLSSELSLGKEIFDLDLGVIQIKQLIFSLTGFYTRLKDAIIREDFVLPDGSTTFFSRGEVYQIQANQNADFAKIYGFSTNVDVQFSRNWSFRSGANYTYGRRTLMLDSSGGTVNGQREILVPQDHIPPFYGQTTLAFEREKYDIEFVVRYNGRKAPKDYAVSSVEQNASQEPVCGEWLFNREGTADNIEQGTVSSASDDCGNIYGGVYGWTTFNLYGKYNISKQFSINLGLENIMDIHYREFASGISAPGRNLVFGLRGKF